MYLKCQVRSVCNHFACDAIINVGMGLEPRDEILCQCEFSWGLPLWSLLSGTLNFPWWKNPDMAQSDSLNESLGDWSHTWDHAHMSCLNSIEFLIYLLSGTKPLRGSKSMGFWGGLPKTPGVGYEAPILSIVRLQWTLRLAPMAL